MVLYELLECFSVTEKIVIQQKNGKKIQTSALQTYEHPELLHQTVANIWHKQDDIFILIE